METEIEEFSINELYTPIHIAKEEIHRRWNDVTLRKKVEEFLGVKISDFFEFEPRMILSRGILTPNFETRLFLDIVNIVGLKPICAEFHNDKFCSQNKDKIHLGKLVFLDKLNKKKDYLITKKTIINFSDNENRSFKEIKTLTDENFIDFHHDLYIKQYGNIMDIFDISIFKKNGESIKSVYEKIFCLCIVNGILFENFIAKDNEIEKKFTENVVLPALKTVIDAFGLKPLVVPLLPLSNEEQKIWMWYPGDLKKYLR